MYNLSICFGPVGTVWAFLFKEKDAAHASWRRTTPNNNGATHFDIEDDYGQIGSFAYADIHGVLLESLDQIEQARIQRALVDERCKAKFMAAAKSDPTIRAAMGSPAPILTPMPGGFRGN